MVVVEGVARSLNPNINIWQVAKPVVERYIRENIGPKTLLRDLIRTAQVVSRFGPRLPQLAEALLIRQTEEAEPAERPSILRALMLVGLGAGLAGLGMALASWL
jgi:ubiquinone biosynthesis protein